MQKLTFSIPSLILILVVLTGTPSSIYSSNPIQNIFMQGNNINTVFRTDGIFNYDKITYSQPIAGLIWPVTSPGRLTIDYATGLWIAAKVGPQHELRNCCAFYNTQYTPGNIPVIGQVPPQSVCNDSSWRGYLINLKDQSLVNGGVRTKTAGGHQYTITYDSWSNWPVNKGAPYVEVNGIPGYQPGWNSDRPGIGNSSARPDEICYMVYMDYTDCTNNLHQVEISLPGGTLPMGAEIQQVSFMFNCYPLQDMYFIKWKIINKSSLTWDSTFIGLADDIDVGERDDAMGCDTARNLGFDYNADNFDYMYGANPPALGTRLLQGPLKYTGNPLDTAILPYITLIGYKILGMTSFSDFGAMNDPCLEHPSSAPEAYNRMRGLDNCGRTYINPITHQPTKFQYTGDACHRIDWFDSLSTDRCPFQSSGPFTMNSGDTQTIVMAFVIGSGSNNFQNVCNIQSLSDSAKKYYYSDFNVCFPIGIQNISTEIPKQFQLYQNYPNPFNPNTKIKFDLPKTNFTLSKTKGLIVFLKVYDALGREVQTLVNENLNPGTYEVDFNGDNLPSGVYFYKLVAGDYMQTKKMVLLK
jgi:hypothetical protein